MNNIELFDTDLPHGIRLACRRNRAAATLPRVMLLHGFPEAAFVWDEVMAALAGRAQCVAPNLRGFAGSSAPTEVEAYRAKHLVADVVALIAKLERSGAPLDLLVAHDWGGAVAWNLAVQRPDLIKHLLIINSPHPATFLRELRDNPAQQAASAYMNFLCRPDAEALLAADDFARLWPFLRNGGSASWLTEPVREQYREVWLQGLTGGCNFYRASPLRPPRGPDDPIHTLQFPPEFVTVQLPTTVLWGEGDIALPVALLDGLEAFVPKMSLQRVPGASHWIVHEQPALVASTITRLLPG